VSDTATFKVNHDSSTKEHNHARIDLGSRTPFKAMSCTFFILAGEILSGSNPSKYAMRPETCEVACNYWVINPTQMVLRVSIHTIDDPPAAQCLSSLSQAALVI